MSDALRKQLVLEALRKWKADHLLPAIEQRIDFVTLRGRSRWIPRRLAPSPFIRNWRGRLWSSFVGSDETIEEVVITSDNIRITIGSKTPYAARHEFRRKDWPSFFIEPAASMEELLRDKIEELVLQHPDLFT